MKHDEALRPIGEVLRALGISRSTLWRWERTGIVAPYRDHRGYRYYDEAQIDALRRRLQPKQRVEA
ncbi:MAG: MerR family transcriptional regulator [Armatimonadia bacterium]